MLGAYPVEFKHYLIILGADDDFHHEPGAPPPHHTPATAYGGGVQRPYGSPPASTAYENPPFNPDYQAFEVELSNYR